ncbi:hypothetical protein [Pendulispora albinea]|uniref:Uncharacterized protein n=1 Tax=Pendulispora albinea TaxID=2741071 RepID=A0ABZ2LUS4_9BACT
MLFILIKMMPRISIKRESPENTRRIALGVSPTGRPIVSLTTKKGVAGKLSDRGRPSFAGKIRGEEEELGGLLLG